jgi:hypothetical protein
VTEPNCACFATVLSHLYQYRYPVIPLCETAPSSRSDHFYFFPPSGDTPGKNPTPGWHHSRHWSALISMIRLVTPTVLLSYHTAAQYTVYAHAPFSKEYVITSVSESATARQRHLPATNFVTLAPVFRMESPWRTYQSNPAIRSNIRRL